LRDSRNGNRDCVIVVSTNDFAAVYHLVVIVVVATRAP